MKPKNIAPSPEAEASLSVEERYWLSLRRFERLYWQLTACVAIIVCLAIVVAVFWQVSLGLLTAVAAGVMYVYFKKDAFRTHLRMRAKTVSGGISITALHAQDEETLFIPARLAGWDVIALNDGALASEKNARVAILYLPATLQKIGKHAFDGCPALREIRFAGSKEAFSQICRETDLYGLTISFDAAYPPKPKEPVSQTPSPVDDTVDFPLYEETNDQNNELSKR